MNSHPNLGKIRNRKSETEWFVYVLLLEENKYYVGITININKRLEDHTLQQKNILGTLIS